MNNEDQLQKCIEENKSEMPIYIGIGVSAILFLIIVTLILYLSLDFK